MNVHGQGGSVGNSNLSSGSEAGSCSSNPTPKATPDEMNYGIGSPSKTKQQKALEKMRKIKVLFESFIENTANF
jgi:hypothetical protein